MKKVFALAALLLIVLPVFAADFTVGASPTEQTVCATDTVLYVLNVQNGGGSTDSYTVSLSGDASKWAVAAPAGFSLNPQETMQVYVYVTPVSGANPGAYDLNVKVNGKEGILKVNVGDCHSAAFSADVTTQSICADTSASYQLTLSNTGKYTETFDLRLTGTAAKWATLSEETIKLTAGQTAQITTTVTPPADQTGLLDLTLTAKAGNSNAAASLQLGVQSNNCYEFDLMPDKNFLSFCENSEAKIPITIRNKGNLDNTYTITAAGPRWISVEQGKLEIPAGGSRTTNLVLFPDFGVSGDFNIIVKAVSDKGETVSEQQITAEVQTCYSTDLKLAVSEDTICPFTVKAYVVSLKNTGVFDERYAITVSGADFATLDRNFADIAAGKVEDVNLIIDTKDMPAGAYQIELKAEAQNPAHAKSIDTLTLTIEPKESCFGVLTTAALTRVQAAPGEGTLVPVIIENKGTEISTYNLEVSGTGAAYAKLNPAVITLEGRRARTTYLYIAVPEETARKEYMLTVSARLEDGTVSSSSSIVLEVVPPTAVVTSVTPRVTEQIEETAGPIKEKLGSLRNSVKAVFDRIENFAKGKVAALKGMFASEIEVQEEEKIEEPVQAETQFLSEEAQKKLAEAEKEAEAETEAIPIKAEAVVESATAKIQELFTGFTDSVPEFDKVKSLRNRIAAIELPGESKSAEGGFVQRIKDGAKRIIGLDVANISGIIGKAKTFLFEKTYRIPNWTWLAGIMVVLAVISYLLKDESTEKKTNGNGKKGKGIFGKFMDWLEEEDEIKPAEKPAEPVIKANDILKEVEKEQQEDKEKPAPKKRGRPARKK